MTIPHNHTISARCQEPIGTFKLNGPSILNCSNGIWSNSIPKCQPTTLFTNYSGINSFSFNNIIIIIFIFILINQVYITFI